MITTKSVKKNCTVGTWCYSTARKVKANSIGLANRKEKPFPYAKLYTQTKLLVWLMRVSFDNPFFTWGGVILLSALPPALAELALIKRFQMNQK